MGSFSRASYRDSRSEGQENDSRPLIRSEDTDDFEWPKKGDEAAKFWVVVISYRF